MYIYLQLNYWSLCCLYTCSSPLCHSVSSLIDRHQHENYVIFVWDGSLNAHGPPPIIHYLMLVSNVLFQLL